MQPLAIAVDFEGDISTRTSSDFEEINYPSHHDSSLPSYYMEDKARRRTKGTGLDHHNGEEKVPLVTQSEYYDDEGKDVYNKRPLKGRVGSGRMWQAPQPRPASLVCIICSMLA
jgi:dolichyl-phosphate-mannose-protein mannosyltransferase